MSPAPRLLSRLALALVGVLAATAPALAEDYRVGDVRIERPWARATAGNSRVGAAYFTLEAVGATPDRLVKVETPVAAVGELHAHMMHDNVMQMRPVGAVEVQPGAPTVLQPGGLHVMLFDLKDALKAGERFPLTLQFERAGRIEIMVPVERAGARGPGEGGGSPMHHKPPGS
ncbi:MAG: copper chaperone PCu(A)C [Proteobacteria bacterium]|nr:copper chaperone PCu(A)C [Pseudomonadota bacterium]